MTIKFSIRQRLHCMGLIRAQRKETDRDIGTLRTLREIMDKIRIDDDNLKLYAVNIPGVGQVDNADAIKRSDAEDPLEVELEKAELRELKQVLTVGFRASVDDLDWWDDLVNQLKDVR